MKRVIIESPLAGDEQQNIRYGWLCAIDSLLRGEAPFGSHLSYPAILRDSVRADRELGMNAGFAWGNVADLVALYVDRGTTSGMIDGYKRASTMLQKTESRMLQPKLRPYIYGSKKETPIGLVWQDLHGRL